ncbi:MAG: sugar phosphate isomerase/epimerase [Acidobacteria bacterium]|nr:sugar phosphate isomerase/epimerase [Acidobacteriota bacterium]
MPDKLSRRKALELAVLGAAGGLCAAAQNRPAKPPRPPFHGLKVGLTSYSTRKLTLDRTLEALQTIGIRYLSLKDVHLPLNSTPEERQVVRAKVERAGIQILGCGVITLRNDEAQIRQALEYARDIGAPTAVVAPDLDALPAMDRVVQDFDLRVAIHNHGPEDKKFPSPLGVFEAVQGLDRKIGCCVDIGHTFRLGLDPAAALRRCAPRLYDIHIKDLDDSRPAPRNVPLGAGVIDLVGVLNTLLELRYAHHAALEYEAEPENPIPGMAASFGYLRGVLEVVQTGRERLIVGCVHHRQGFAAEEFMV